MSQSKSKPLMRSLGEFFGHIVRAVKTDPRKAERTVVRKTLEERQSPDDANVILRRTTIEEVEIRNGTKP